MNGMENIRRRILEKYPAAKITMEVFPRGAAMLDIRLGTRLFVCSFTTLHGYGIDEAKDGHGLTSTFSHAAPDEERAIDVLYRLIEDSVE